MHKQALQILLMANMPSILMRILNPNPEYVPECQGVKLSVQVYTTCTFHKHQFFVYTQVIYKIYQTEPDQGFCLFVFLPCLKLLIK